MQKYFQKVVDKTKELHYNEDNKNKERVIIKTKIKSTIRKI